MAMILRRLALVWKVGQLSKLYRQFKNGHVTDRIIIQYVYSTSKRYNTPLGIHRICNDQARGRGHYKCNVSRAGVLSTYLRNNEWAYQRCTPIEHAQMLSRGIQQKKWRTLFSPSTQFFQYILGLNSRTYELLVPLRSVQQPIMPGAYLIGPI